MARPCHCARFIQAFNFAKEEKLLKIYIYFFLGGEGVSGGYRTLFRFELPTYKT